MYKKYIKQSASTAQFLIEIPIGPITPEYTITWTTVAEAKARVENTGLRIIKEHVTWVNPNVDLFAEPHDFNYGSYLMLCQKN